ncbi:hypothetical protein GWI33_007636 [Rhynchophorus ferrugineus]|uniref:Uncharacterized protein n=1 Tax=Rhynchophorus ferrugineus TaxID=354439 RepID=A0A834IIK3_RHYFE|nr:hypothetical protein GWI33_007636 [Rhynchophorus ferrugineus]
MMGRKYVQILTEIFNKNRYEIFTDYERAGIVIWRFFTGSRSIRNVLTTEWGTAAQKLNLSSPHRRKRYNSDEVDPGGFCGALQKCPPPVPPALLRRIGVKEISGVGKVGFEYCQYINSACRGILSLRNL